MKKLPLRKAGLRWLEVLLSERFGHEWCLSIADRGVVLRLLGSDKIILFDTPCAGFGSANSDQPCAEWEPYKEGWNSPLGEALHAPAVSKLPTPLIEQQNNGYVIHYDILGLCYWMLARVEEVGRSDLDSHQRFPATSSHAFQHGYLNRPIVDEWLNILKQVIQRLHPDLQFILHKFQMHLSHDVDRPSRYGFASLKNLTLRMAGDLKRGKLVSALTAPYVRATTKTRLHTLDIFNTFDWLMDKSEFYGQKSVFNFICGHTSSMDGEYDINHPAIRSLMRKIHLRGHEIGLHPSYNTCDNPEKLKLEAERLLDVCVEEGIHQSVWGGRMHYLRWRSPGTLHAWTDTSMNYDGTLGYADHAGFRTGSCFEYPAFDPVQGVMLSLRIRPLIAMDGSLLSPMYMDLSECIALKAMIDLKNKCRKVGGIFSLLWHNSEVDDWGDLYLKVLAA